MYNIYTARSHKGYDQHCVTQHQTSTNHSNQTAFDPVRYLAALHALVADGPNSGAARAAANYTDRPYLNHYRTLDDLSYARLDDNYLRAVRNYVYRNSNRRNYRNHVVYCNDVDFDVDDVDLDVYAPYDRDEIDRAARLCFDHRYDPDGYDVARNYLAPFNRFGDDDEWN
ncbi:unnamed protein product [Adineta steineri]|uniref:Uncharacterized protein n=1 Tax=Adineta steineri TaxID=433720 RepID=A0A813VYU7_9BILA|nr:unnamed protein product [Adineta steineri]CAF0857447.1 unnamed protein product [Adineta steineri]CAF1143311.1 unnamed protein product [Adineta steineri]